MENNIEINLVQLTSKDKEAITRELINSNITRKELRKKYNISETQLKSWVKKYLTKEEREQIIKRREENALKLRLSALEDVLNGELSINEISTKYNVSEELIKRWCIKYLTAEQKDLIKAKKKAAVVVERDNLAKIRRCEKEYSRIDTGAHVSPKNDKIRK